MVHISGPACTSQVPLNVKPAAVHKEQKTTLGVGRSERVGFGVEGGDLKVGASMSIEGCR